MKKSNRSSGILLKLGSNPNVIANGVQLQAIPSADMERLRTSSYKQILP